MKYILNNDNFEINGKQYLRGVGDYYGNVTSNTDDLATVINDKISRSNGLVSFSDIDGLIDIKKLSKISIDSTFTREYNSDNQRIIYTKECGDYYYFHLFDTTLFMPYYNQSERGNTKYVLLSNEPYFINFEDGYYQCYFTYDNGILRIEMDTQGYLDEHIENGTISYINYLVYYKLSDYLVEVHYLPDGYLSNNIARKADVNKKQDKLTSGTNIKTINGESILGSGDIEIEDTPFEKGEYGNSAVLKSGNNQAKGNFSTALGYNTVAKGEFSHAEGEGEKIQFTVTNIAEVGEGTTFFYVNESTEGLQKGDILCYINGGNEIWSHVFGISDNLIKVTERFSPTPVVGGVLTVVKGLAYGQNSHSQNAKTVAYGDNSHAEGFLTSVIGFAAHGEGVKTKSYGWASHAEGQETESNGEASHAEGYMTETGEYANASHAEGYMTQTTNVFEHAQGRCNLSHQLIIADPSSPTTEEMSRGTLYSVGIGMPTKEDDPTSAIRMNAHEIMQDGKHFILGVGGYDGTNPDGSEDVATVINEKVDADGSYPNMSVGKAEVAEDLGGRPFEEDAMFNFRPSADAENSIKDGLATIKELRGNAVVWNNLATTENAGPYPSNGGASFEVVNQATIKVTGKRYRGLGFYAPILKEHKYLILATILSSEPMGILHSAISGTTYAGSIYQYFEFEGSQNVERWLTPDVTYDGYMFANWVEGEKNFDVKDFHMHDLTLMFGTGKEPTTLEEFYARMPIGVTSAYNSGELVAFSADGINTIGFNAWDEQWEQGTIGSVGENAASNSQIRSKNYCDIIGGQTYNLHCGSSTNAGQIILYDKDKNYLDYFSFYGNDRQLSMPEDARYFRLKFSVDYGTIYKNDVCVNLSHTGYRNGEYNPYEDFTMQIDPRIKEAFPNGMTQWDKVYNKNGKGYIVKGSKKVAMNTITGWGVIQYSTHTTLYANAPKDAFNPGNNSKDSLLCSNTPSATWSDMYAARAQGIGMADGYIRVYIDSLTDVASAQAYFKNATLWYELANPEIIEFETPFNLTYKVWDFGTEQIVSEQSSTPINATIEYDFNANDTIRNNKADVEMLKSKVLSSNYLNNGENVINGELSFTTEGGDASLVISDGDINMWGNVFMNGEKTVSLSALTQLATSFETYKTTLQNSGTVYNATKIGGQTIDEIVEQIGGGGINPDYDANASSYIVGTDGNGEAYYSDVKMENNSILAPNGFFQESDETLKLFHDDIEVDLDRLVELPKKYFHWLDNKDGKLEIGTSAQEVQKLYPEIVMKDERGVLSVDYSKLSLIALKAIDVLNEERKQMQNDIAIIKSKLGL